MRTAQQYPRAQPPYARAYPQDHWDADTPLLHVYNTVRENASAKIRQGHEQVDTHALRLVPDRHETMGYTTVKKSCCISETILQIRRVMV